MYFNLGSEWVEISAVSRVQAWGPSTLASAHLWGTWNRVSRALGANLGLRELLPETVRGLLDRQDRGAAVHAQRHIGALQRLVSSRHT